MKQEASKEDLLLLQALLEEQAHRKKYRKLDYMFPDSGKYARENYKKQMEFFKAGKDHKLRMFMAGNQSGKTLSGTYECALHATGLYPSWWEGLRFSGDIDICLVGNTAEFTRNILQEYLLGDRSDPGTGFIPKDSLKGDPISKAGTAQAVSVIPVQRADGSVCKVYFKDYTQGRDAFMGDRFHFIMLDEEPPSDIFTEAITRTATTNGSIILTFTPLHGYSQVVEKFLDHGITFTGEHPVQKQKYVVRAGWDDIPHMTEEQKELLLSEYPAHEREARSKGIPSLGEGAVFFVPTGEYIIDGFSIPKHWPRAFGMDPGNNTAAVWAALDPESGCYYIYSEYFQKNESPAVHASAIMNGAPGRENWITGTIDPSANNAQRFDLESLYSIYRGFGLNLVLANNAREAGLLRINHLLASGQLKIFSHCTRLVSEMTKMIRDDKGKVKNQHDYHATDALRYVLNNQLHIFRTKQEWLDLQKPVKPIDRRGRGASSITGY